MLSLDHLSKPKCYKGDGGIASQMYGRNIRDTFDKYLCNLKLLVIEFSLFGWETTYMFSLFGF